MKELEVTRTELRIKTEAFEDYKQQYGGRDEELRVLRRGHQDYTEIKESLRREELEGAQLKARLEQVYRTVQCTITLCVFFVWYCDTVLCLNYQSSENWI